ncbi:MAG: carbon-nitrogen hydrolase family protein [Candidatus Thorarchaeota archaeon]
MTSFDVLKICVLQPTRYLGDFRKNLKQYERLLEDHSASLEQSHILCLPEYWNGIGSHKFSFSLHQKSISFLTDLAVSFHTWIIGGSHLIENQGKYYNRCHVFDPTGKLMGTYDKRRPFGYEKARGLTAGTSELIWSIGKWKVGVRICNDLWNVSDYAQLIKKELDVLFCPILTTVPNKSFTNYGRFMWYNLALIRAKEGATALVVSDSAMSPIREPYWSTGASCIADPSQRFQNSDEIGLGLLTTISNGEEGILIKKLNYQAIRDQRHYRMEMGLLDSQLNPPVGGFDGENSP